MGSDAVAIVGFLVLFALMLLRLPVGMAMGLVGVSGFAWLVGGAGEVIVRGNGHASLLKAFDGSLR